jgi:hypothetical protein
VVQSEDGGDKAREGERESGRDEINTCRRLIKIPVECITRASAYGHVSVTFNWKR